MKLTQTTGPTLGGKKPKGRKNSSLGKGDLKHNKFKKNNEKAEKYYTNEETEVQINEEEICKLDEKNSE